jgi:hypothetical protein
MKTYLLLSLLSGPAYADDDQDKAQKVVYKQRTEIDFEGLEIEGQLLKPNGSLVLERKAAAFNPLIKLRTDFNQEMNLSVEEMK